jgi:glucosylceramidase
MNSIKKINAILFGFSLVLFLVACSKNDTPGSSGKAPTNLQVSVQVAGATSATPNGDGSGTVNISVSATNATTYQIILPAENKTFTLTNPNGGSESYTFTAAAGTTTTYSIQVIAYNGSVKKDTTLSVTVYIGAKQSDVAFWLTTPDKTTLFQLQNIGLNFAAASNSNATIVVNPSQTYQTIDGFGYALTDGSAQLINQMSATNKSSLLSELFDTSGNDIGVTYLRLTIGASDLSPSVYSYDDMPAGQTDESLAHFSVNGTITATDVIPVLQQILTINPNIKTIATPWSAPAWMKDNGSSVGGNLLRQYYGAYADYFVKYIQAMQAAGIPITAVTPQNEPENPGNNPSMLLPADSEAVFIEDYLAPAFQAAGITAKIVIYDHNCDDPGYPESILANVGAAQYVDGSAFHLYAGDISAMGTVHNAYPNKNLYFTEQYTDAGGNFGGDILWHIQNVIVGATTNWSKNAIEWNLASDPNEQPHTPAINGSTPCTTCLGAVTISGSSVVSRNQSYYIIAHVAKFVRPGSVRIASTANSALPNVAFQTPGGKRVLIVLNTNTSTSVTFNIQFNGQIVSPTLPAGAVGTFVW